MFLDRYVHGTCELHLLGYANLAAALEPQGDAAPRVRGRLAVARRLAEPPLALPLPLLLILTLLCL